MFFKSQRRWCTADGQQRASGMFLALFSDLKSSYEDDPGVWKVWGAARHVRMHQMGHFMMGDMKLYGGETLLVLSGTYGSDGLTNSFEPYKGEPIDPDDLVLLPLDLARRFWSGGGHNEAGDEASFVYSWAQDNEKALRAAAKKRSKEVKA